MILTALREGERFGSVNNARAWLFEAARNTLGDRLRVKQQMTVACQVQLDASDHVQDLVSRPALQ
ncbi:hypothetical protein HZ993_06215 [Rhodoferax sp. AJA081-3]|uniref:hypothetical protein n=1 Tax=Rhodoferax sp. AJA081-3 TaxID=2752316 RepID=UPI001ADF7EE0|nr:hypothetical protein [Rhodoferax sp. AJA081-3]QTN29414.1 hypothetical protein HZ993_06215 [Rhodoferax sp. AJA081-3]